MPPETFNDNPHYTESVDIFSLGVLVVEVATHSFPSVGMMGIGTTPEVERRAKDLKKMKADHPLKPLVLNCLRNNYKSRPDIDHVICGIIRIFTRQLSVKDKEIEDLRSAVETKDLELVLNNDIEEQVSDKDRDIAHLTSIVEMKDRQKAELEVNYVMQSQLYSYYTFDTYVRFSNFSLSVISLLRTEKLKASERL
jgi:serine/threonine protein kinase